METNNEKVIEYVNTAYEIYKYKDINTFNMLVRNAIRELNKDEFNKFINNLYNLTSTEC